MYVRIPPDRSFYLFLRFLFKLTYFPPQQYIINGYHASHDPANEFTTEPTTGWKLNVLDIPGATSVSSGSSCCTCERYGITQSGERVKLDCGGGRCGYIDDSSECSSEDDEGYVERTTRRQGVVVCSQATPFSFCGRFSNR